VLLLAVLHFPVAENGVVPVDEKESVALAENGTSYGLWDGSGCLSKSKNNMKKNIFCSNYKLLHVPSGAAFSLF